MPSSVTLNKFTVIYMETTRPNHFQVPQPSILESYILSSVMSK